MGNCPYTNKDRKINCPMYFGREHPSMPNYFPEEFLNQKYKKNTCEDPSGAEYWKACPMYKLINPLEKQLENSLIVLKKERDKIQKNQR